MPPKKSASQKLKLSQMEAFEDEFESLSRKVGKKKRSNSLKEKLSPMAKKDMSEDKVDSQNIAEQMTMEVGRI